MLAYYEENFEQEFTEEANEDPFGYSRYNAEYARLYKKCRSYMDRILNVTTPLAPNAVELQEKFSSEYLSKQIELMLKMQSENPTDAIGKAKELIEYVDSKREAFHKRYTDETWGDARNYQLTVNSSVLGVEQTAEQIIAFIDKKHR